jgi:hypothetical protein
MARPMEEKKITWNSSMLVGTTNFLKTKRGDKKKVPFFYLKTCKLNLLYLYLYQSKKQ